MESKAFEEFISQQCENDIRSDGEYNILLSQVSVDIDAFLKTLTADQIKSFLLIEAMVAKMNSRAQVIIFKRKVNYIMLNN
jgi:hypothetical protein